TETVLLDLARRRLRLVDQAADVEAMRQPCRRPVVAGGEDVLLADDRRADLRTIARRAIGHLPRDRHEVLVPGRSLAHTGPNVTPTRSRARARRAWGRNRLRSRRSAPGRTSTRTVRASPNPRGGAADRARYRDRACADDRSR